jgi:hypothetical protein
VQLFLPVSSRLRSRSVRIVLIAAALGYPAVRAFQSAPKSPAPEVRYPAEDAGVDSLARRAAEQKQAATQFRAFHDFHFEDKLPESGITFRQRIVDDSGLNYKAVHYDHGNGIAVADVDGDGLYDIYFVNQAGPSELWKNLGGGKFRKIDNPALAIPGRIAVAASFADIDNDGDEDLYVTTVRGGNLLFENDGKGNFRDITRAAGLTHTAHSSGSVFFDYDHDGLLDLLVCDVGQYTSQQKGAQGQYVGLPDAFSGHMFPERFEHPVLYHNLGHNRFQDVTAAMKLTPHGWCGDAAVTDLNGDGWPDIYFLNMMGANHYYENQGGKSFIEKTSSYFPKTSWGAMGIKFFDYDNDGKLDLLVTDMHSDMVQNVGPELEKKKAPSHAADTFLMGPASSFVFGNSLYHNLGGGKFEEVSDKTGVENYWPWGPSVGDINADGWDDIFIASSMNFPFRYGINSMLLNEHGAKFVDAEFVLGIEPRRGGRTHTPWFQLNCSAMPPDPQAILHRICEGRTGMVTVMAPLGSRAAVLFDLDNDGDLDIVTSDFNSEPQILISDLSSRRAIHWLKVKLTGTVSNRDGLGATVRIVTAGGARYMKYNDGKSGYLSQSSLPLYFGLGDETAIARVEVRWPSGRDQVLTQNLRANETLQVTEPK